MFLIAFLVYKKSAMLFCLLSCILIFSGIHTYSRHKQNHQRILVAHVIKGHDVFTCIEGRKAYIISDSAFLRDSSSWKFFIEPYLLEKGIRTIKKLNSDQNLVLTNICVRKDVGFQFYDKIMTMQNTVQNTIQTGQIVMLKKFSKELFKLREENYNSFIISNNQSKHDAYKLKNEYFKCFRKKLELNKKAIVLMD